MYHVYRLDSLLSSLSISLTLLPLSAPTLSPSPLPPLPLLSPSSPSPLPLLFPSLSSPSPLLSSPLLSPLPLSPSRRRNDYLLSPVPENMSGRQVANSSASDVGVVIGNTRGWMGSGHLGNGPLHRSMEMVSQLPLHHMH